MQYQRPESMIRWVQSLASRGSSIRSVAEVVVYTILSKCSVTRCDASVVEGRRCLASNLSTRGSSARHPNHHLHGYNLFGMITVARY